MTFDRRLYMQLLVFTGARDVAPVVAAVDAACARADGVDAVVYESALDPRGVGLLTIAEEPDALMALSRALLDDAAFGALAPLPAYTMLGRTYAIGYERDLEGTLLTRPRERALDPAHAWAVWYPLRRSGSFERLDAEAQRAALMEHGMLGRRFGEAGLASDLRLASHGLDANDNDFTIGLVGPRLHPLSELVQAMRATVQTSVHVERMGPFFVGRVAHRRPSRRP